LDRGKKRHSPCRGKKKVASLRLTTEDGGKKLSGRGEKRKSSGECSMPGGGKKKKCLPIHGVN